LYLEIPEIEALLKELEDNTKAIKEELLRICWFMRGGISYNESHLLCKDERELIAEIIEGNLKTTKESGLPFF
jgi:hypothetical protein